MRWKTRCAPTAAASARPDPQQREYLAQPGQVVVGGQTEAQARRQDHLERGGKGLGDEVDGDYTRLVGVGRSGVDL